MQDPAVYAQIKPQFPEQEHLKCPRCDSMNTKFCYYNNYNLSQPRHFCKNCKRYWTKGGALRNIPVGGGSRKNAKRSSSSSSSSSSSKRSSATPSSPPLHLPSSSAPPKSAQFEIAGLQGFSVDATSFTSLLTASGGGQFGNLLDGSDLQLGEFTGNPNPAPSSCPSTNGMARLGLGLVQSHPGSGWSGASNDWPDLSMYTPDPTFQ
ncbi:unnamed protein product [Cuscuta epithymum]|uniref:Dof zinc finger protein n=1 Tax=Cuscuta epithymum TaxID=186058 RepID=A0AAV0C3N9_9ASTE|nr:unnamed protein product [Cuscuta epithymum]